MPKYKNLRLYVVDKPTHSFVVVERWACSVFVAGAFLDFDRKVLFHNRYRQNLAQFAVEESEKIKLVCLN